MSATLLQMEQPGEHRGAAQSTRAGRLTHRDWRVAFGTACGPLHESCEDAFLAETTHMHGISVAIADGVSKGDFGAAASAKAVKCCMECGPQASGDAEVVRQCVLSSDAAVAEAVAKSGGQVGATCLAAAWLDADGLGSIAHVGDCRIYAIEYDNQDRLRLSQITQDQTFLNLREVAPEGVSLHNPARMIGLHQLEAVEVQSITLAPGSGLLFSTDGLHEFTGHEVLERVLGEHAGQRGEWLGERLQQVVSGLLRAAADAGSTDDIGVGILWRMQS